MQEKQSYHIGRDTEDMDKRPLGPASWTYCLIDNPSDGDYALPYYDQREKAHSDVQVSVLKADLGSKTGYAHDNPHLESEQDKPNGPYVWTDLDRVGENKEHLSLVSWSLINV